MYKIRAYRVKYSKIPNYHRWYDSVTEAMDVAEEVCLKHGAFVEVVDTRNRLEYIVEPESEARLKYKREDEEYTLAHYFAPLRWTTDA